MFNIKKIVTTIGMLGFSSGVLANTLLVDASIDGGENIVSVITFDLNSESSINIETLTNGFDPYMHLSDRWGNYLASDDDGGLPSAYGYNNSKLLLDLSMGSYRVDVHNFLFAASDWGEFMLLLEAPSGVIENVQVFQLAEPDELLFRQGFVQAPLPGAAWLFGSAIAGLGFLVRRK
ncbi:hypothetical protein EDC56_1718 [Sinobacterium caligoides]|uniref:Secreted protein n=1 Tax=Sinobacterium caligoides TaxID=933926 RepID=A0A3N2DNP8_9GAMM|nr:hypothetical protein [Sinobacterium caligoides]ROS01289.1 hypothetical protein EDC56_1718 [Sinobacterium caligoides]